MVICIVSHLVKSIYQGILKYKLYHIPFWFVYHYLWWTLTIGSISEVANNILYSAYSIKFGFYVIFQAAGVYFNLYFLVPRFLEKGRYVKYLSFLAITIVCTAAFIATGYYVSAWLSEKTFMELYGIDPKRYFYFFQINTLPSTAASMTLAMSVKLTKNWIQSKQKEKILEKEKLETELKFLRSQFNPHFLFNTINSIFILINKDPVMASESLARFSELLRYQLYECNETNIPLKQELLYLDNFIKLEELRQDDNIELSLNIPLEYPGNMMIAPFILVPFVENAFKHVSRERSMHNWIKMDIRFDKSIVYFEVANSVGSQLNGHHALMQPGGIGLKNIRRRLDLLYDVQHELTIHSDSKEYRVMLTLNLHAQKMPYRERVVV